MADKMQPSTDWKEVVAADEMERFTRYGEQFAAIQARKSVKYGVGRALHRKQLTAAAGTLEVLPALPDFARHGLFAATGQHEVWVRLSNGGMNRAPDAVPDIRGFALRVFGVQGESALGNGPAKSQDFLPQATPRNALSAALFVMQILPSSAYRAKSAQRDSI